MGLGSAVLAAAPTALRFEVFSPVSSVAPISFEVLHAVPVPAAHLYPTLTSFLVRIGGFAGALEGARFVVRYLARHTGLPALVVAAILLVVGYRVLKRSARFAVEVVVVTVALVAATQLGWLHY
jgi:hypothetical protein